MFFHKPNVIIMMVGAGTVQRKLKSFQIFSSFLRRISMMGISKDENFPKKRRKIKITFNEDEEVINPEDIDPSVGRFRNMITTTIIPNRYRYSSSSSSSPVFLVFA